MAKQKDEMPTAHCRVGVQHRMNIAECAKMDAGADTVEEAPPDDGGDDGEGEG